ncbi:MAG: flagellar protein FlaG [Halothiobacillaceae bacterium]
MKPEINIGNTASIGRLATQDAVRNSASMVPMKEGQEAQQSSLDPQQRVQKSEPGREAARDKLSAEDIRDAVDEANEMMQSIRRDLRFEINDDAERLVVKVINSESGDVIRQIPSDEMLGLIAKLKEMNESGENVGALIEERL